jgi:uncharacterized protein (DUF952 family)
VILHLMPSSEWARWLGDGRYEPASVATEGFVHCTGDDELMLAVANRFYAGESGDLLVVTLDEGRLSSEVRWEAPAHPDGSTPDPSGPQFPHVYGPLDGAAVVEVRRLRRAGDRLVGYEPMT